MMETVIFLMLPTWFLIFEIRWLLNAQSYVARSQMAEEFREKGGMMDVKINEWPDFAKRDAAWIMFHILPLVVYAVFSGFYFWNAWFGFLLLVQVVPFKSEKPMLIQAVETVRRLCSALLILWIMAEHHQMLSFSSWYWNG